MIGMRLSPERFGMDLGEVIEIAQKLMKDGLIEFLDMSLWDVFKEAEADLDQEEDFKERKNKTIIDALTHFMGPGYRDRDWFPSDDHLKDEEILATIENIKTRGYV